MILARRQSSVRAAWISTFLLFAFLARGQNIIEERGDGRTAAPIKLSRDQVEQVVNRTADFEARVAGPGAEHVRIKLERHVNELLDGAPWKPFHHTLGISGYEAYFDHPDQLFYSLAIAGPRLSAEGRQRVRNFLSARLASSPPYAFAGFNRRLGRERESYQVPDSLRRGGLGEARSIFGVYAFWAYCHWCADPGAAKSHWTAVQRRVELLLTNRYGFDIYKGEHAKDEAEILNGDIAGLIGFVRLARANSDARAEQRGLERLHALLELRINLDRVNPRVLEKTSASKNLHAGKLARYCDLAPELGEALREWTDGCAASHLRTFRQRRNAWFLAFGDRMIGGENYTNPLHFSRALFAGAVFVERLPADEIAGFVDVPWCKADFYFIEKCAFAMWAASGHAQIGLNANKAK